MHLPFPRQNDDAATSAPPTATSTTEGDELVVYGTDWCGDCYRARRFLDQHQVPYRWVDADKTPGATDLIKEINRGRRSVPTLVFPDGSTLTEPSNSALAKKLGIEN